MDFTTTYVRGPNDDDRIRQLADGFRDDGFFGPPIVVHTDDTETQKRWVVSDPHRHAAAARAGVDPQTVELRELFAEAGLSYDDELVRARQEGRGHAGGVVPEEVFVGSQAWADRVVDRLPDEVRRKYWTER